MKYSKYNFIYRLQKWMDGVAGQTFLNYAYSWGASVVILGTLLKLTHLPSADFWLFLGMGTEVFVFFLAAFDRPFDKTTDGMDLKNSVTPSQTMTSSADLRGLVSDETTKNLDDTVKAITEAYRMQLENIRDGVRITEDISKDMKAQAYVTSNLAKTLARLNRAVKGEDEKK